MNKKTLGSCAVIGLVFIAASVRVQGQSADALIDKLVSKGILTVKEANELREETDKNFTQAYSVKSGMPDWVTSFKLNGDLRMRAEGFYGNGKVISGGQTNTFDQTRYRYRLRFGATATFFDNLEAGFRFTTSEPGRSDSTFGGDPISGNATFKDNASKKFLYVDLAYAKWYALNGPSLSTALTIGKMENPFVFDDMIFDQDYTPEGIGLQSGYRFNDQHALKLNLGAFVLDELAFSTHDPFMLGAQVRWDATWSQKLSSTLGFAALSINNSMFLTNGAVPNQNVGNSRGDFLGDPTGHLTYHFNPLIVDGALIYTLESFPLYKGAFPVKLSAEYMNNPAAPSSADNFAWNVGFTLGKSGKRGTWQFDYVYKWLGANSWYEEVVDSDFGATYFQGPNSFQSTASNFSGYGAGTNTKGHIVKLAYSPTDALTFSVKWFLTDLIATYNGGPNSQINRLQLDGTLKF